MKAANEGIELKKGTELSMRVHIHAEATLLAYHLQHPQINPYRYFGGSKLSCHGCATLFSSFNLVAESFHLPQYFTKGCHNKIYIRWPCPSLLSPEQQMQLRPGAPSLDTQVRKEMIAVLSTELATYVHELCAVAEEPSRPQSDSTTASGDSDVSVTEARARMQARAEAGMCE
jgi:OTT_1508-like deaminase